jgi:hypothetical protein
LRERRRFAVAAFLDAIARAFSDVRVRAISSFQSRAILIWQAVQHATHCTLRAAVFSAVLSCAFSVVRMLRP